MLHRIISLILSLLSFLGLHHTTEPAVTPLPCTLIHHDADHTTTEDAKGWLIGSDYTGEGVWYDKDGNIIGYAAEEDGVIYATRQQADRCPIYES